MTVPSRILLVLVALLALASGPWAQDRFEDWDDVREPDWRFDPDNRPVYGFSVPSSVEVRGAFDRVESALREGDTDRAARQLVAVLEERPNHVVQVGGAEGRWVGAGEWAIWHLLNFAADQLDELAPREVGDAVDRAADWRDLEALSLLARRWEPLPESGRAATLASRLLAERGAFEAARVAARRAATLAEDENLSTLARRLPGEAPPAVESVRLPASLEARWQSELAIERIHQWLLRRSLTPSGRPINPFRQHRDSYEAPVAPIAPVVRGGTVYVADSISVTAIDQRSGRELWHHEGPMEQVTFAAGFSGLFDLGIYARSQRPRAVSPYQLAQPTLTTDKVLATVHVPEPRRDLRTFDNLPINWPLPRRRIVALDQESGEVIWSHAPGHVDEAAFTSRFDVMGPVVVEGDTVYAGGSVTEGAINAYVAAFDLETGALRWRTLLCSGQQDLTMFNRPFQEHLVSPPLLDGDNLYICSNLGLLACIDAWSGRIRWLSGYRSTRRRAATSPDRYQVRPVFWTNHPPLMENGLLVVTPLDSDELLLVEPKTGRILDRSRMALNAGYRHDVLGLGDGRVLLAGSLTLECLRPVRTSAETAQLSPEWIQNDLITRNNEVVGAVTVAQGGVYVPLREELLVVSAEDGRELRRLPWESGDVRRVVPDGPVLLMTDNARLYAALDVEDELSRMGAEATTPGARLRLAELLLNDGRLDEARRRFEDVLATGDPSVAERARTGRLEVLLRLARLENTPERWEAMLSAAAESGGLVEQAPEALVSLDRLGADPQLDHWLGELAQQQPDLRLRVGELGPWPVRLLVEVRRLPDDEPERGVVRLQQLIGSYPEEWWNGRPVRDEASGRIGELIERHGRQIYRSFDWQAEQELKTAEGAEALARIERRYPNAQVVKEARSRRLRGSLEDGLALEVLDELGGMSGPDRDTALMAEAARRVGDTAFADLIEGRAEPTPQVPAPTLAPADSELVYFVMDDRFHVTFPRVHGRFDPPYDGMVLGAVNGRGHLFLLDLDREERLWSRELPGGVTYLWQREGHFIADGDHVIARCGEELVSLSLDAGERRWSVVLRGQALDTAALPGLVLCLTAEGDALFVTGYTRATGARALRLEVPGATDGRLLTAGLTPVVFAQQGGDSAQEGARLLAVDVARGTFGINVDLPGDAAAALAAGGDPAAVMCMGTADGTGGASWLGGWDVTSGAELWRHPVGLSAVSRRDLIDVADGDLLLAEPIESRAKSAPAIRLTPLDPQAGPGEPLLPPDGQVLIMASGEHPVSELVLSDVSAPGRLDVFDPVSGQHRRTLTLDVPPRGYPQLLHGRDGFVLVSEQPEPAAQLEMWVVRGESEPQRYSIEMETLHGNGLSEMALVEGAILVARGGTIAALRSAVR